MTGKSFALFTSRTIVVHIVTYFIAGMLAYFIQWGGVYGGSTMQTYMKPSNEFGPWVIPSQILRGLILAVALYPFLGRILELKRWGWLSVSSLYLLIGTIAGSGRCDRTHRFHNYSRVLHVGHASRDSCARIDVRLFTGALGAAIPS